MGKVTEELVMLITKQVQDHGIVVWYDPEQAYSDVVDQLHLPETTVLRYQDSFFALRHRLEPFLEMAPSPLPSMSLHGVKRLSGRSTLVSINSGGRC